MSPEHKATFEFSRQYDQIWSYFEEYFNSIYIFRHTCVVTAPGLQLNFLRVRAIKRLPKQIKKNLRLHLSRDYLFAFLKSISRDIDTQDRLVNKSISESQHIKSLPT